MRYEDTSGSLGSAGTPQARDDADKLPQNSNAPATGNVVTGAGTTTGKEGADTAAGGHVVSVRGAGGTDTSDSGGDLHVQGRYGTLTMDEHGSYRYVPEPQHPENVRDLFQYTLASAKGQSTADLVIELGGGAVKINANAQQVVPGPDGVVTLPAGVDLSDVHVLGRDLVVNLPDGSQIVIVDGAVFVPQLVLGGVEVPSTNLAALLIDAEPKPAAGSPQSGGGNFEVPVPPLDPGTPLGDLIPPVEMNFPPPVVEEIGQFIDKEPEAGTATALLDDDTQANNNPLSNVGDDPGTDPATGSLPGSGGDGELTWALTEVGTAPAGSDLTFELQANGDVWVLQGSNHVITISVDPQTGDYTVDQLMAIAHEAGGNENNLIFTLNYTVTDQDGDTATGTLTVNVDDDMPTVTVQADDDSQVVLTTHDALSIPGDGNPDSDQTTADFSGVFGATSVVFGADGAGPTSSSTYALAVTGSSSGLSSHGVAINLYLINGVVVGSTATTEGAVADGNTIFTVATDNSGVVTLTQFFQIDHPIAQDPTATETPFDDQIISMADHLITLTRSETAVDGDGDEVTGSASIDIGANLHFTDDGPTIDPTLNEVGAAVLDESPPSDDPAITLTGGITAGNDPDLSGGLAIGKGSTSGAVVDANAAFGADGPAAGGGITYDLVVLNSVSGLTTTDGTAINLVELSNGVVVGVVDGTSTAAFAISIDSSTGVVSVEQYLSLFHPDGTNPDDVDFLAEGSLGVTVTATDFDGDTATSDPVDITSLIQFHDDGPSVTLSSEAEPSLTVDETNFGGDAGPTSFAAMFNFNFGADGPADSNAIQFNLGIGAGPTGLVDTLSGLAVVLSLEGGEVVGRAGAGGSIVFVISVDGDGNVSLDQQRAVVHADPNDPNDSITFLADNLITLSATVTDGDGDQATVGTPLAIAQDFHFLDDAPSVAPTLNANATVTVDESLPSNVPGIDTGSITKGNDPDLSDATGTAIGQANSGSAIVDPHAVFGADGPAASNSISYALSITSISSGVTLTDGSAITLELVNGVIVGVVDNAASPFDGQAAFAIAINSTTGVVTVEQYLSLDHPINPDPNDALQLGDGTIAVTVTATDGDGDHVTSGAVDISDQITFLDDGPTVDPTVNVNSTVTVDESLPSSVPGINTGAIVKGNDPDLSDATGTAIGQANSGTAIVDPHAVFGADGPAASNSIGYSLSILSTSSGLTLTDGTAINLQMVNGVIVGVVDASNPTFGGQAAFAIAINSTTGVVTVEQYLSLDHPVNPDPNDPLHFGTNVIGVTVTATDGDGDPITSGAVDIGGQITFLDDGPTANPDTDSVGAVGTTATGNVLTGVDHGPTPDANVTDGVADVGGADGRGSITNLVGFGGSTDNSGPSFDVVGQYGTLHMDANGDYTYTRTGGPGGATDTFNYTFVDGDGDPVSTTLTITLGDAAPVATTAEAAVDDDALGGIAGGPGDINANTFPTPDDLDGPASSEATFTGLLGSSSPGDGPTTFLFLGSLAGTTATVGTEQVTYSVSNAVTGGFTTLTATISSGARTGTVLFTVNITNTSTGQYTVTLQDNVLHASGGNDETSTSVVVDYQMRDSDGDNSASPGHLTITFNDDTPSAAIVENAQNVSIDESVGIQADSNDTTSASVIALFSGVSNPGTDTDLPQYATNGSPVVSSTGSNYGADGAGTTVFSLTTSNPSGGVDSGLNTTDGTNIFLFVEGGLIVGRVGATALTAAGGPAAFAIAIDQSGHISTVEYLSIQHPDATNPDDTQTLIDSTLKAVVTVTDADGDVSSTSTDIGNHVIFQDSGPVMTAASNINIENANDVAANGTFAYNLGADGAMTNNDVIKTVTGSATVNGSAVQNYTITQTSEDSHTAVFTFSFDYSTGVGTAHETGTLTFYKDSSVAGHAAGTYTVDLANPIQGITTLQTALGQDFTGYVFNTTTETNSQPDVSVTQITNNFFVQFTGFTAGNGDHETIGDGDTVFENGELFSEGTSIHQSWVSATGSSNGVAGDTVNGPDGLNFNLYSTDPQGLFSGQLGNTPTASADSMFLRFDGIDSGDDLIVVLKLWADDGDGVIEANEITTKAIVIDGSDIFFFGSSAEEAATLAALTGTPYQSIAQGIINEGGSNNNDGLVIIESSDYNGVGENYKIVGAQIINAADGITGTGIDLNGDVGTGGESTGTEAIASVADDSPLKITNIGFTTPSTVNQNAELTFNVTVQDGDGDTVTQTITASVTQNADSSTPISLDSSVTSVVPVVLDLNGDGAQFLGTDAGVHYNYGNGSVATAWASPQDGILVLDGNHNGTVDGASEFVFGSGSVTDLQALAAYDSNHDGQLTSADAAFSSFAVWQDANSNGVADAGEVNSLTALGITSISLSSDGVSYTAAGGDVQVAGTGSYTNADGSTGSLADAAFLTAAKTTTEDLKSSSALASNAALIAAVAAAGLAAEGQATAAAHASVVASLAANGDAQAHSEALAPVALDAVSGSHVSDLMPTISNDSAQLNAQSAAFHASDAGQSHGLTAASDAHSQQAPTELLQGVQAQSGGGAVHMSATAASVAAPSAQQLTGADSSAAEGQHSQVVGQVLADALHGGSGANAIDALINTLPSHGAAGDALDALASHAGGAVPNMDTAGMAGFITMHTGLMEQMVAHQAAVAPHA